MGISSLFGGKSDSQNKIELNIPDKKTYRELYNQNQYLNKDSFWRSIKSAVENLSKFKSVVWKGDDDSMRKEAETATRMLLSKRQSAVKENHVIFFCMFFGDMTNILKLANVLLPEKGYQIAKRMVDRGAICLADLPKIMDWPKYKPSYWGDNLDSATFERWQDSDTTSVLATMSGRINGAAPHMSTSRTYYVPTYPFLIPTPAMIYMVTGRECPKAELHEISDPKAQNLTLFSGDDLFGNEDTIQNLILSGVLQPGKTKIGISVVKRFNALVPLRQFPENAQPVMSRSHYVVNAAFLNYGEPSSLKLPEKPLTDKDFLNKTYDNIKVNTRYSLGEVLAGSVKNTQYEFFYAKHSALIFLFINVAATLRENRGNLEGMWIGYEDFSAIVNNKQAYHKYNYIYPDTYSQRPESIRDVNNRPLPVTDFKSHFHDRILRAMVEGFAAIGGVDLLYNESGDVAFLRLSDAGKWYLGLTKEMPRTKVTVNLSEALDIDDQTGLILVKHPDFPYLNLLTEFAEKMTDSRYCFSEKAFLKKCSSPEVLKAKIKRFKMFVLPEPGPTIQGRIERMLANCNLVRKTPGGSTYQLFDIDPKNIRLHNIIVEDKDIRKNSLRVEGCKLLVKTKFVPNFLQKLEAQGYLTDIEC